MNKAIQLLERAPLKNANFLYFYKTYGMYHFCHVGHSVAATGTSDREWIYISSDNENELKWLLENMTTSTSCYAIIEDWMIPIIQKDRSLLWQLSCERLYFPDECILPDIQHDVVTIDSSEANYIYDNYDYKNYTDIEYITKRLTIGEGLGIYDNSLLVAWAITHDDGAIGFLHVLEDHRKKGYALSITNAMIKQLRSKNRPAYVHIEKNNVASLALAKKIGFIYDRTINWFELS